MAKVPKQLFANVLSTTLTAVLYTAPAVTKTVLRHIHLTATATTSVALTGAGGGIIWPSTISIIANTLNDLWGLYTLEATQSIQGGAGVAATVFVIGSGDEIVLG